MNSESKSKAATTVRLYRTAPHDCSYLRDRQASTLFMDPEIPLTRSINSQLNDRGFRRSGRHIYKPDCEGCRSCISCRIPAFEFEFSRSGRRILARNKDLRVVEVASIEDEASFELYARYIQARHLDGDMFPPNPEQFLSFLAVKAEGTRFFHFHAAGKLLAVAVVDELLQGLSAVYTFFDPQEGRRSLGRFVVLWQIQQAAARRLPYVYLGYWVRNCRKMEYKINYRPLELYVSGKWVRLS